MQDLQSTESQVQENKRHFFNFSFFKVELPLMEKHGITEFCNKITENSKLRAGIEPATFTLPR